MAETKNVNVNHRQRLRSRYEREGADSLETHELLELFLFDAIPRVNTNPIAHALLNRFCSLNGVLSASKEELMEVRGIGERSAEYIVNASRKMNEEIEKSILEKPMSSFERASNALIWHRRRISLPITVIALTRKHRIIRIVDLKIPEISEILKVCTECEAARAVIGVGNKSGLDVMGLRHAFLRSDVILNDIIYVDGYTTESV